MTEIRFTISDNVAREAEARGLLNAQTLESLLRAEFLRRPDRQLDLKFEPNGENAGRLEQRPIETDEHPPDVAPAAEAAPLPKLSAPPPRAATEPWEVEQDIFIPMPPISCRPVKIRVKYLGLATPEFFNDYDLDDYDLDE